MKKTVSAIIILALAMTMLVPLSGCGAKASEGLEFKSNGDGTCAVSGIGTCVDDRIVIPSKSPDGDEVTFISDQAFLKSKLRSVEMPDTIISIGTEAFCESHRLETVEFSSSLKSIGSMAFMSCDSITELKLPDSLEEFNRSIGSDGEESRTFYGCSKLTSINIPQKVKAIYEDTFEGTSLKSVKVEGDYAFGNFSLMYPPMYSGEEDIFLYAPALYLSESDANNMFGYNHIIPTTDSIKSMLYASLFFNDEIEVNNKKIEIPKSQYTVGIYGQKDEYIALELTEDNKVKVLYYDDVYGEYELQTSYETNEELVYDLQYDEQYDVYRFTGDFYGYPDDIAAYGIFIIDTHMYVLQMDNSNNGISYLHLELGVECEK